MNIDTICKELQALQRQKVWHLKSRMMVENRLRAMVASHIGYHSGLAESDREKLFKQATAVLKAIGKGEATDYEDIRVVVLAIQPAIDGFSDAVKAIEKKMLKLVKQLPVAAWVQDPQQRGFGLLSLATVIGEAGNLSNYANPGKLWKRLGCAPFEKGGVTQMGATWKSGKGPVKLHASDWEEFGYSPRRRSISYLIGENIVKQNKSIYRERYDAKKEDFQAKRPETSKGHCHNHGMLLATKLMLKNLWVEWNGGDRLFETDDLAAVVSA